LNISGFQKLHKAKQLLPFGAGLHIEHFPLFLSLLLEKLTARERTQFLAATGLEKSSLEAALKLESETKKLERVLASAKLQKPSTLFATLSKLPGEQILFILMRSNQRIVVDRLRNYLQKYLPAALEITETVVQEHGGIPGTPKFLKLRNELIATRLDSRPRKAPPVEVSPPPPPVATPPKRQSTWGR
jgi:hypothetical protein